MLRRIIRGWGSNRNLCVFRLLLLSGAMFCLRIRTLYSWVGNYERAGCGLTESQILFARPLVLETGLCHGGHRFRRGPGKYLEVSLCGWRIRRRRLCAHLPGRSVCRRPAYHDVRDTAGPSRPSQPDRHHAHPWRGRGQYLALAMAGWYRRACRIPHPVVLQRDCRLGLVLYR